MSRRRSRSPAIAPPNQVAEVTRGGVVFELSRTHVRCMQCRAMHATDGDGDAVQAFFAAHTHKPAPPPATDARARLDRALEQLGADELEVLAEVAAGLQAGRPIYGELDINRDRRDHEREALDEVRDGLVYAAIAAIKRRRAAGRGGST